MSYADPTAGTWSNPSFPTAGGLNAPQPKTKRSLANAGPVPKATGVLVIGAVLGLAALRRGFRGA